MGIKIQIGLQRWEKDLLQGLKGSTSNRKRSVSTILIGLAAFLLTVFSASPEYSAQMISAGTDYWSIAFLTRFSGMYATSGINGILLTAIFSILVGVTITNTAVQLSMNKIRLDSLGALPGFLAAGCASCSVGVLSLLGLGGVLASLPFQGNLLRLAGIILLTGLIVRTGDPDKCKI